MFSSCHEFKLFRVCLYFSQCPLWRMLSISAYFEGISPVPANLSRPSQTVKHLSKSVRFVCLFVCVFDFLTSSSTLWLYRGRVPRLTSDIILQYTTHETERGDHQFCLNWLLYTVSTGYFILSQLVTLYCLNWLLYTVSTGYFILSQLVTLYCLNWLLYTVSTGYFILSQLVTLYCLNWLLYTVSTGYFILSQLVTLY